MCQYAAYNGNSIGGISYAYNISACYFLADGYYGYDSIDSTIVSCCNKDSECIGFKIDGNGLPNQCGTSSPTSSPTFAPTSSPTFSNNGANKGKYDKGNAKGGENGK